MRLDPLRREVVAQGDPRTAGRKAGFPDELALQELGGPRPADPVEVTVEEAAAHEAHDRLGFAFPRHEAEERPLVLRPVARLVTVVHDALDGGEEDVLGAERVVLDAGQVDVKPQPAVAALEPHARPELTVAPRELGAYGAEELRMEPLDLLRLARIRFHHPPRHQRVQHGIHSLFYAHFIDSFA